MFVITECLCICYPLTLSPHFILFFLFFILAATVGPDDISRSVGARCQLLHNIYVTFFLNTYHKTAGTLSQRFSSRSQTVIWYKSKQQPGPLCHVSDTSSFFYSSLIFFLPSLKRIFRNRSTRGLTLFRGILGMFPFSAASALRLVRGPTRMR